MSHRLRCEGISAQTPMSPEHVFHGAVPVVRTFVHFSDSPISVCARSAPPEAFVDRVVAQALSRERRIGERRRQRKTKRVARKWARLLEGTLELESREAMEYVRGTLSKQLLQMTPRLRHRLNICLYHEFAHVMFPEKAQELLLWKMGVLRHRAEEVQFWYADEPLEHSTMVALLDYARRFLRHRRSGAFSDPHVR